MVRKSSFRLPKLRLHKASGRGVVELSGKQHYLGQHGTAECQAAYDRLVGQWLASGKRPLDIVTTRTTGTAPAGLTVVEVVERYLDFAVGFYQADGKPTRGIERMKIAARILTEQCATIQAAEFGPLRLRSIQSLLIERDNSRKHINSLTGSIKRIFKWAASMELCPASVFHALQTVGGLKRHRSGARECDPVLPVRPEVVKATLPKLGKVVADMITVQFLGAMRPQEICNLRPMDIEQVAEDAWLYRPGSHKTAHLGRARVIPLNALAMDVLRPYLDRPAEHYCFSPREAKEQQLAARTANRKTPLSCGNRAGMNRKVKPLKQPLDKYAVTSYGRAIANACRKVWPAPEGMTGEPLTAWHRKHRWKPNQLRHLAGTIIRAESGLEEASNYLGHADAQITLVYAERDIKQLIETSRKRTVAWTK